MTADPEETTSTLPLLSEEVDVAKTTFETARVSVSRVTKEASELISTVLADETVEVSRTPIGRQVDAMPAIRQEGDTIVVPIVEERLVVERRLFLKEEVRVRRVRATRTHQELVPVRHHELVVSSTAVGAPHYGMGPAARSTQFEPDRSSKMNYHTVVAAFDSGSHARAAANALKAAGFTGLYARQVGTVGWLGLAGFVLLAVCWALQMCFIFANAFILPLLADQAPEFIISYVGTASGVPGEMDIGALGPIYMAAAGLYMLGGLLFGIATFRAGVLPRWPALIFAVASTLTPAALLLPHDIQRLAAIPVGLALAWLGYALWSERRETSAASLGTQRSPVGIS